MEFTKSLIKGKLIKRYKRFFTDVKLDKEIVTAHCPNTGSMRGLLNEGNNVYLLPNNDPKRKLKYGLEIIKSRKNLVGVNTHMANRIAQHGLENNLIKELKNNESINEYCFPGSVELVAVTNGGLLGGVGMLSAKAPPGMFSVRLVENSNTKT